MSSSATGVPQRVKDLQAVLESLLADHNKKAKIQLVHDPAGFVVDGGWVHLVVTPTQQGVRAYEFVQVLGAIEGELRKGANDPHVLLVPAIAD